jgi:hypothetical protein
MSSIEDRLSELKTFALRVVARITDHEDLLASMAKRIDQLEQQQNYALRAFFRMHPEHFADLDRGEDGALAYGAFLRVCPETSGAIAKFSEH